MKLSARNIIKGKATSVKKGAVNAEIVITTVGGDIISAIITNESCNDLLLESGRDVFAIIKASWIIIAKNASPTFLVSARNKLNGQINEIKPGKVNSEIKIQLKSGENIYAIITNQSVAEMNLVVNDSVVALFKASSVIVATAD